MSGIVSFWIVLAANLLMVWQCVRLYREDESESSKKGDVQQLYLSAGGVTGSAGR